MTNITIATFPEGVKVVQTEPLHQYDFGQILRFSGIDDVTSGDYEVHFSNSDLSGSAKSVTGSSDGVIIPDEYLASGADVHAWIYTHTGASDQDEEYTDGRTSYEAIIPVLKRARPTDMPPTPVGRDTLVNDIQELQGDVHDINESITEIAGDIDDLTPRVETLEGAATSLQSQITALGTLQSTTVSVLGVSCPLIKIGKTVNLTIGTNGNQSAIPASTDTLAGTLPQGYRPAQTCIYDIMTSSSISSGKPVQVNINTNGEIRLYNWGAAQEANSGFVRGTFIFLTA